MLAEDVSLGVLDILYEDEHLLAVNKAAGMVVHPTYKNATGTLMDELFWHAREWPLPQRPSFVSRLDKFTSGVVVVAKTAAGHAALQRAMAAGDAEKDYLAVVHGQVIPDGGEIDLCLGHDPSDRRRMVASPTVGAPSLTLFTTLARGVGSGAGLSLLRCRLRTGRTHQIRVHLAALGWPVVGDSVYGSPAARPVFPRQALHAWRVAFAHPSTGDRIQVEAPLPSDLQQLITASGLCP
jgi:23S rRNA pseudouridine1911/1915/1917 synthase